MHFLGATNFESKGKTKEWQAGRQWGGGTGFET